MAGYVRLLVLLDGAHQRMTCALHRIMRAALDKGDWLTGFGGLLGFDSLENSS